MTRKWAWVHIHYKLMISQNWTSGHGGDKRVWHWSKKYKLGHDTNFHWVSMSLLLSMPQLFFHHSLPCCLHTHTHPAPLVEISFVALKENIQMHNEWKKWIHVIVSLYKSKPLVLLLFFYSWFQIGFEVHSTKNHEYVTVELVRDTIALIPEK